MIPVRPIGRVESGLVEPSAAPLQGDEGGVDAWLALDEAFARGLTGLRPGQEVFVLTWLDRADSDVLAVHPRGDASREVQGVFATRSQDRPNPIGLHRVRIRAIEGSRVRVGPLEAVDGTPVLDLKPVMSSEAGDR